MALAEPTPQTAAWPRWLSIVGIGEDGIEGLTPVALNLVKIRRGGVRRCSPPGTGGVGDPGTLADVEGTI